MEVLTLQTRVYYPNTYITQMELFILQTRVYYPDGSINIANTSILPRWTNTYYFPHYKHEYITQMEVLQTRVYYPDGSINITNTSILPSWKY